MSYLVKEIFYSIQGEGVRAGTPAVFVRFAECNLRCTKATHGFDCDTDFLQGTRMELEKLVAVCEATNRSCSWIILTGGEPMLQVDRALVDALHRKGFSLAIETNGTVAVPLEWFEWITVSPKVPPEEVRATLAHEAKFVIAAGELPRMGELLRADHVLISPAFDGEEPAEGALEWCVALVKDNPRWRLSVQQHKGWGVR